MRTAILILLLCSANVFATATFGQKAKINLNVQDISFQEAVNMLQNESDYFFFYKSEDIPANLTVSASLKNAEINKVMDELLKNTALSYKIVDKYIAIVRKTDAEKTELPQQKKVSGTVKDDKGITLPGVSVIVKGTTVGTVTNIDGTYTLEIPESATTLVFSYIGMKTFEVEINGQDIIDVILEQQGVNLDEIVVVGYGTQQKRFVTGSVSKVNSKDLSAYTGSNFAQQMTGKASGITVNDASAQPGTDPKIIIRGVSTLTAGSNPLIVVDGYPLTEGSSLNSINPSNIETIDVLKDPASAAIYGSRAANGVILISTKKGKTEKAKVTFDMYAGIQQRSDKFKLVDNAFDAATYYTEARNNAYVGLNPAKNKITDDRATRIANGAGLRQLELNYIDPYLERQSGLNNTDWFSEIFQNAPISNYNVSFSGGSGKTNFYVSADNFNQQGIVINTGLKRYSGIIKVDSKLSDKFEFGISMNPSYNTNTFFTNNASTSNDIIAIAIIMMPFFNAYNDDGSLAISEQIKANTPEDGALPENPVAVAKMTTSFANNFRTFGNTYLSYNIIKNLKFKIMLGGDYSNLYQNYFSPSSIGTYRTAAPKPATAQEINGSRINYLVENTLTYTKVIGKHDFNLLGGYSFQKENSSQTTVNGTNIPDDNITNISGASSFSASSVKYKWTQVSYFGRLQYLYNEKYIASATMRSDGSSRFGKNNQWGYFPSFTGGWILSKESFYPKNKIVTFAKLRVTWGKTGNNQIGNYGSYALVSGGASANYINGSTLAPGFTATTTPNPNLTWETKVSNNIGLDVTFFNMLNLTAEYYMSKTEDLLLNVPVPEQSGYSTALQNIGEVQNNGLELDLSANGINLGEVKWNASAFFAFNENKVLALAPGQTQIISGNESNIYTKVGHPMAEYYGYKIIGVYKNQDEISGTGAIPKLSGTQIGDYKVEDVNGDGLVDTKDLIPLGTYLPKFTYGFNSSFSYNSFDFSFGLNGVQGRKVYDRTLSSSGTEVGEGFSMCSQNYFDNRFDPNDNPNGTLAMPNTILSNARKATKSSTYSIKDASYLRIRNVQLAYNLKTDLLKKAHMSAARIYVTANNLFTFTKYEGLNPDATSDTMLSSGQASTNYPIARSFVVGLNLTF